MVLGLVARQRHQPGFGLRRNRRLLARSSSVIKRHQRPIGQRPFDATLDRLMMHTNPPSDGKKRRAFAISQKHLRTLLAGSVRDRETLNRRAISSSVITTSIACRHVAMISLLLQLFSNKESTSILPVPRPLASSKLVSWNRSSSDDRRQSAKPKYRDHNHGNNGIFHRAPVPYAKTKTSVVHYNKCRGIMFREGGC